MRRGETVRAMPRKAAGLVGATSMTFEDLCEQCDVRAAISMDALIRSLPPAEECAISHVWLHAVWRFNRESREAVLERAHAKLLAGMDERGIY